MLETWTIQDTSEIITSKIEVQNSLNIFKYDQNLYLFFIYYFNLGNMNHINYYDTDTISIETKLYDQQLLYIYLSYLQSSLHTLKIFIRIKHVISKNTLSQLGCKSTHYLLSDKNM